MGISLSTLKTKKLILLLAPLSVSCCLVPYTVRQSLSLRDLAAWYASLALLAIAWLGFVTTLGPPFVRRMGVPVVYTTMRSPLSLWMVTLLDGKTEFWPALFGAVPPDGCPPSDVWGWSWCWCWGLGREGGGGVLHVPRHGHTGQQLHNYLFEN